MNKDTLFYGIDISKAVFDVMDEKGVHSQFKNNYSGFKKYLKLLAKHSYCVMEATGYYHYKLAYLLLDNNIKVSVENPLSVKRYIQMKLSKIKTV
jgi:transposase